VNGQEVDRRKRRVEKHMVVKFQINIPRCILWVSVARQMKIEHHRAKNGIPAAMRMNAEDLVLNGC
jgi:hypothetical protein